MSATIKEQRDLLTSVWANFNLSPLASPFTDAAINGDRDRLRDAFMRKDKRLLSDIHAIASLLSTLREAFPVLDYATTRRLVETHGTDALHTTWIDRENPAAMHILSKWIGEAMTAPESLGRDPVYDTPLQPPGSASPAAPGRTNPASTSPRRTATPVGYRGDVGATVTPIPSREEPRPACKDAEESAEAGQQTSFQSDKVEVFTKGAHGSALRVSNSVDARKTNSRHVVFVEMAPINQDGCTYNWANKKLTLMMNDAEVEQMLLVLMGLIDQARFSAHGSDKKKWLSMLNQPEDGNFRGRVQVTAGDGSAKFLLNIFPQDISRVASVLMRGYKSMRNVQEEFAVLLLRSAARNYRLAAQLVQNEPRRQAAG